MQDPPRTPAEDPAPGVGWGGRRRREPVGEPAPPPPPPEDDLYVGAGQQRGPDTGASPPPPAQSGLDFSALFVLLDAVRRAAPPELQERITTLIREALLTLRSLIDWYLERLERRPRETRVEDIPID